MKDTIKNVKLLLPYFKGDKSKIIIILLINLITIVISVLVPILNAQLIVNLTSNLMEQLILIAIVLFVIKTCSDILLYISNRLYIKLFFNVSLKLRKDVGREVLKLNNKILDENGSGAFIQRLLNDTSTISRVFEEVSSYLRGILINVGVFISIFIISKVILIFVAVVIIIRFIIEKIRLSIKKKKQKEIKEVSDKVTGFAGEMVRGAKDIRMLNAEGSFLKAFTDKFIKLSDLNINTSIINFTLILARWILNELSTLGLIVILSLLIMNNQLEVAFALVIFNYRGYWNGFVDNITFMLDSITDYNIASSRVFEIINGDKFEKESFGNVHLNSVNGDFEFKNVSFSYKRKKVLKDLSFKVNANETVAFVGKSGAGKTTIFSLLCKMYDNYKGEITIDGNDIKTLDKDSIRGNITIVSQDPYIFNMSIKDNLKLVCDNLTNKQMKEACKMACLDEFIESLPDKYDTIVGEGGVTLSGGQKQRLAIARAFVQKTEIILFDEATSALDNETQKGIAKAINNLQQDYTILIIAHRLSTIKNADRILFIDDGKVVAEGSHKYLLNNCKEYKALYDAEIEK